MPIRPRTLLRRLVAIQAEYDEGREAAKLELFRTLSRRRLDSARDVLALHEALCFLQAYPDGPGIHAEVERLLAGFGDRGDLRRFARRLADSGVVGTPTHYSFYWSTARWLRRRCPGALSIDWPAFEKKDELDRLLYLLVPAGESLALDEADLTCREWVDWLKGNDETDADWVIRRFERMRTTETVRESLFENLEIPFTLAPGPGTPARTGARCASAPIVFQTRPLDRTRPDISREARKPPLSVRPVSKREGQRLIDLAREAMVTRSRDLFSFKHGDPRDVRMVDCGEGLRFAAIGLLPEYRLMLDSVYGFLTLGNGVPLGYVLTSSYFNSSEVAYNVFETYRGGESARIYGRVLGMVRHLFGANAFTIDPYQLGHDNDEGLKSGAWWFYYKLGFRPRDPEVNRMVREELRLLRADRRYRTSVSRLNQLSAVNMFYYLGKQRDDIRGIIPLENIGLAVSRYVAERFGADRERAVRECAREARRLTGLRSWRGFSAGERLAWERWSPLMLTLPGVEGWSPEERRELARVARAKGGRYESDFVIRFDAHRKLRRALLRMAAGAGGRHPVLSLGPV